MRYLGCFVAFSIASTLTAACFQDSGITCEGGERCNCFKDGSCNTGLVCLSSLCVNPNSGANSTGQSLGSDDNNGQSSSSSASSDMGGDMEAGAMSGDDDAPASGQPDASGGGGNDASMSGGDAGGMPPGNNLVVNGDFSMGSTDWGVVSGAGNLMPMNGELCVVPSSTTSSQVILGWPESMGATGLNLTLGTSYTFKYSARTSTGMIAIDAKVGESMSPYNADFETPSDMATTTTQTFTHTFMPMENNMPANDPSAGIAFQFSGTTTQYVCVSNVSFVQN